MQNTPHQPTRLIPGGSGKAGSFAHSDSHFCPAKTTRDSRIAAATRLIPGGLRGVGSFAHSDFRFWLAKTERDSRIATATRGAVARPGSKATSRAKGARYVNKNTIYFNMLIDKIRKGSELGNIFLTRCPYSDFAARGACGGTPRNGVAVALGRGLSRRFHLSKLGHLVRGCAFHAGRHVGLGVARGGRTG
jgi:hypothetical protein